MFTLSLLFFFGGGGGFGKYFSFVNWLWINTISWGGVQIGGGEGIRGDKIRGVQKILKFRSSER